MKDYKKFLGVMIVIMLVSSIMSLISPIWLRVMGEKSQTLDIRQIIGIILLLLCTNLMNSLLVLYRENYANKFNKENARRYIKDFLDMDYNKIIEEGPSNLLERIITAVTSIYAYMTVGYVNLWSSIIIAAASIILLIRINIIIVLLMLLYIPLMVVGFKCINNELKKRSMELQAQTGAGFQEILSYIKEPDYYKQLSDTDSIIEKMNPSLDRIYDAMARINKFAQTSSITISSLGTVLQNVIMLVMVYSFTQEKMSPYVLIIITIVIPLYFESITSITKANIDKKSYDAAIELGQMIRNNREQSGEVSLEHIDRVSVDVEKILLQDKEIVFNAHAVLKKGDIGRIYGESGSGKSTFAKALLKFRQLDGIKINEVSLNDISNRSLRTYVEYVSQNIPIISGTLRDNLLFGKEYLDVEDDFFLNHPLLRTIVAGKSLDDEIFENGANLSGGEKQKIAIARALISNPELLILDEVCSNIDAETSAEIYSMLEMERNQRITIIISHDDLPTGFTNVDINQPSTGNMTLATK